jgi:hypothetical protein
MESGVEGINFPQPDLTNHDALFVFERYWSTIAAEPLCPSGA